MGMGEDWFKVVEGAITRSIEEKWNNGKLQGSC